LAERGHKVHSLGGRPSIEESDHRHRHLLCARGERACCRYTTEKRDELAPVHLITSSARAFTVPGIVRPLAMFLILFVTTGIGNGSTYRKVAGCARDSRRLEADLTGVASGSLLSPPTLT
jgi:hypothetical protein